MHETPEIPGRPTFPKRAVITSGMPYGNKNLHFGHIAGVFVPADVYARFLRDRIGAENVLFVCGTDCYGSPIAEGHRKLVQAGEFDGTVRDYVQLNHDAQKSALDAYGISLDIYEGSGLGLAGEKQHAMTQAFITKLYENGWLEKRTTPQFYDVKAGTFLNGRQVIGHCPVQGCKSEKAYADECDLGHQFDPVDLIAPVSQLSGETPEMRDVTNWYFKLPEFHDIIEEHITAEEKKPSTRSVEVDEVRAFLEPPVIYISEKNYDGFCANEDKLPAHTIRPAEKGKNTTTVVFSSIEDREQAVETLHANGVQLRTGKTLVPFRLTGNIEWGIPAPRLDESLDDLTVWCWPESLWAPIAFTQAALEESGRDPESWRDWWANDDARVYQFIGQDNLYFYGVAQTGLWAGTQSGHEPRVDGTDDELRQTTIIPNFHVLFCGKKASSSGSIKPPMAADLLDYYTPEQLRAHWISLGLGLKPASFAPKPYALPMAKEELENARAKAEEAGGEDKKLNKAVAKAEKALEDIEKAPDPVLKESALLTNIFNRIARSCFYTAQKYCNGSLPLGGPSEEVAQICQEQILEYERHMSLFELHACMAQMDLFLRDVNKWWSKASRAALAADEAGEVDQEAVNALLRDAFHYLRCAIVLMHPIVPKGCELIFSYLDIANHGGCGVHPKADPFSYFFAWGNIFQPIDFWAEKEEKEAGFMKLKELPPHFDFFEKHESQI